MRAVVAFLLICHTFAQNIFFDTEPSREQAGKCKQCTKFEQALKELPGLEKRITPEKGDPGDNGDIGPEGEEGPLGPKGVQGLEGEQGPRGKPGPGGDKGRQGVNGLDGEIGLIGVHGANGDPGDVGLPGRKGKNGRNGQQGERGERGMRAYDQLMADLNKLQKRIDILTEKADTLDKIEYGTVIYFTSKIVL